MHRVSVGGIYSAKLGSLDNRTLGYPQVAMKESNCANPTFLSSPWAERGIKSRAPNTLNADTEGTVYVNSPIWGYVLVCLTSHSRLSSY